MSKKIVLIGAGSAMFTRGLIADVLAGHVDAELALVDIDPHALRCIERLAKKMIAATSSPARITASTDRRDVLPGATAVICTVGVGGRRAWEQDVFIPRKLGIYQPVGDTIMPGGISRAMRMIPAMIDIARDVVKLCPDALFFNYSNPMAMICRAVRRETDAKMIGLCHSVNHVATFLANALGVPTNELTYTAAGINHLTWFTEVRHRSHDMLPKLIAMRDSDTAKAQPFTWQMLELFGAFPAVLDRHIVEFFPHLFSGEKSYFGKTLGLDAISFEDVIRYGDDIFSQMQIDAASDAPLPKAYFDRDSGEHEQVIDIIDSIENDRSRIFSANLPNRGQIENLPIDAIVETPAMMTRSGPHPIHCGRLPEGLAATLASKFHMIEIVVEAAITGRRDLFAQALLLDGSVKSIDVARQLADELIAAQKAYLPQF